MEITSKNREEFAWLAGIIDGEGCFSPQTNGGYLLGISQNSDSIDKQPELLLRIQAILDKWHIHSGIRLINAKRLVTKPNHNPSWRISVSSFQGVQAILAFCWSWLGRVKKQQYARMLLVNDGVLERMR